MKRIADALKSILPILLAIALQLILEIVQNLFSLDAQYANVIYGLLALLLFGIWYRRSFIRPTKGTRSSDQPGGFSFHTIVAIFFLGIGMQYVTRFVADVTAYFKPDWADTYNTVVESAGYANPTLAVILYTILLAPIAEELIFRGLTMRYVRRAGIPFVLANIWQAAFFGLLHGNWMQGIYAFVMGLFLGFVAHRGRGIKYSILVHIVFNIMGLWFSGLIALTVELNYAIAIACGTALTIFASWLFYTDFRPQQRNSRQSDRKRQSRKRRNRN